MKISLSITILILMAYLCMTVAANTAAVEKSSSKIRFYEIVKTRMTEIIYRAVARAIDSPNFTVIDTMRFQLRRLGTWMAQKENNNTFIGRCFGVARQLKIAMPLIMIKLGVIVTILVFLTVFSLKTMGLVLLLFMFGASNIVAKFAVWKDGAAIQPQRPQNVHFHIHQSKHGEYLHGHTNPWEKSSSENFSNNIIDTDAEFQEKLNLLAKYQQGFYNPYNGDAGGDLRRFRKR